MKVQLKKLESTHENLRSDIVVGNASDLPEIDYGFVMCSRPLELSKDFRFVCTSPVRTIEKLGNLIVFTTENSTYELTILEG